MSKTKRWLLAGFFLFMLACTMISRIYDSITVPKVLTGSVKRKAVETVTEGTGTVVVKEKTSCHAVPGLRILFTPLAPGSQVQEGQVLFQYDEESMTEKKEELERETEQIRLNMKKEQISQEGSKKITQEELARRELENARKEFAEGLLELEETKKEQESEKKRLEEEYEDSLSQIEEELWQQQDQAQEEARLGLDASKNSRDRELRSAQRKVEDLTEQLDNAQDEDQAQKLERELERAIEDLDDLKDSWSDQIDSAQSRMEALESQDERIRSGKTSAQKGAKKTYEEEIRQLEEKEKEAQKAVGELEKAVEQAGWQLEIARRQDASEALSKDQQSRIHALTVRGMELDLEKKQRELDRLNELIARNGEVRAWVSGTVAKMELTEGKTATGEEELSLAVGEGRFTGTFLKEEQNLALGDHIEITVPGTAKKKEAVIGQINLLEEQEGTFQADLHDDELPFGSVCRFTCSKQSGLFEKVIPLSALRKDMEGYFCLVARTKSTVLGEEFRAERVNVELLYRGSREAAVEGSLFESDALITGENQSISAGDRVRPVSGF